ncbi:growth hormone releasing hormone receptor, like isoform X5 [Oryzias latipes]
MSSRRIAGIFITVFLAPHAVSRLHPECEFIFQLEREERRCLQYVAEQGNRSSEGCWPFWDAVACWPRAVAGETVQRACPAVFSLFKNNTGSVSRNCTGGGWSRPFPPYHVACSVDDDIPESEELYFTTVKMIYTVGYGVSLVVLTAAVLTLLFFRRLRCARNFIHIQLFGTFILKSVAVFIKDATLFSSDETNHCTLSTPPMPLGLQSAGMGCSCALHSPVDDFQGLFRGHRMLGHQRGLALLVDHQRTDRRLYSGEFHALHKYNQNPDPEAQSSPDPVQQLLPVQTPGQVHPPAHPFVWNPLHVLQLPARLLQREPAPLHRALHRLLPGAERAPHAVAEVAREELWGGLTCCKGQPDGHALLTPSWRAGPAHGTRSAHSALSQAGPRLHP